MKALTRDIRELCSKEYDVLIVGGGIFGACALWEAASRGLSAAIVEKRDFSHATSANHFKMAHGGIRYLQHADIYRIRESCRERSALLRIAPHLVQPLPILIPTYGHGVKGKTFLGAGMFVYDLLTCDRNRGLLPERKIPWGKFISRQEVVEQFPAINTHGLTGGAVFCDGQIYNPPRLALSFLRSAVAKGATAANYIEVTDFLRDGDSISGVIAEDVLSGERIEVKAKVVLNTAGPWAHRLLKSGLQLTLHSPPTFSRDLAFVVRKPFPARHALACFTKSSDTDTVLDRGGRHLFLVPWRHYTLVGVWHKIFEEPPEALTVSREEMQGYVNEINSAHAEFAITLDDISVINTGLTLFGEEKKQGAGTMSFGKRSQLIDHSVEHGVQGLITLIGVRATTARGMAEKAIDLVRERLQLPPVPSKTEYMPICGGDLPSFEGYAAQLISENSSGCTPKQLRGLLHNYGTCLHEVLAVAKEHPHLAACVGKSDVLQAEVVHAVRYEMAQKLADVVLRRTDLGTGDHPGEEALAECAQIMAAELGWSEERVHNELGELNAVFDRFLKGIKNNHGC